MTETVHQQRHSIRLVEKRAAACLLAFSIVTVSALAVHFIWGDVPEYSNDPAWVHQPTLWIWTLVLVLLGGPAVVVLISNYLPMPAGRPLAVDSAGIRFPIDGIPKRWKWADIDRIEYYAYPGKSRRTQRSFVRVVFHKGKPDKRIRDEYEQPLKDIFDQIQSARRTMTTADAKATDPSPAAKDAAIFEGDREKSYFHWGDWSLWFFAAMALILGSSALEEIFEIPRWLDIGSSIAMMLILVCVIVVGIGSYVSLPRWRLIVSPDGLSFIKNRHQVNLSWSDIAEIRVHCRVGSPIMRHITIGVRPDSQHAIIGWRFRGLFDRSRLVIPDAFFTSVDEIADRLRAFQDRALQAKT